MVYSNGAQLSFFVYIQSLTLMFSNDHIWQYWKRCSAPLILVPICTYNWSRGGLMLLKQSLDYASVSVAASSSSKCRKAFPPDQIFTTEVCVNTIPIDAYISSVLSIDISQFAMLSLTMKD